MTIGDHQAEEWPTGKLIDFIKSKMDALPAGARIRFNLEAIKFPEALDLFNIRYGCGQTAQELQYLQANWFRKFGPHNVTFYYGPEEKPISYTPW